VVVTDDVIEALGAEPMVETLEYRASDGLLVSVGIPTGDVPSIVDAFWEWLRETNHPASVLDVENFLRPVIKDAPVVAAAVLEAVDEFLAQYEG
jgi:hypothetical protein